MHINYMLIDRKSVQASERDYLRRRTAKNRAKEDQQFKPPKMEFTEQISKPLTVDGQPTLYSANQSADRTLPLPS
jgi:hypothetical protein